MIIIFILITAFFVLSEFSIIRSRKSKVKNRYAIKILDSISLSLSTCQIGITASTIALGGIGEEEFKHLLNLLNINLDLNPYLISAIISIPLTMFGEIIPKSIGLALSEKVLTLIAIPLYCLNLIIHPISWSYTKFSGLILSIFNIPVVSADESYTDIEIRDIVEHNVADESTRNVIDNVFDFELLVVSDIMTHRQNMVSIDLIKARSDKDYLNEILSSGYGRFPVIAKTNDDIRGILHIKDFLSVMLSNNSTEITRIMKKPFFVPETLKIKKLFDEMTTRKTHMAIVIDEYSGVSGLVTMEDILETIMGSIKDEHDESDESKIINNDGVLDVDTDVLLDDLIKLLPSIPDISSCDTVSGLLNFIFEKIPEEGDVKVFSGCKFIILKADGKQCKKVRISLEE